MYIKGKVIQRRRDGSPVETHESMSQAARAMGVNESSIRKAIKRNRLCCGYIWTMEQEGPRRPKILILDIETAPSSAYVWRMWKENISQDQIISDWFIICWSAKWLGSPEIISERLTPSEAVEKYDYRILGRLWALLDEADIVIAHNGNKFDIPKINTRFIVSGFLPTRPYKQIDTLLVAQKEFAFSKNSLNSLAEMFGIPGKLPTSFKLWERCLQGDAEALKYMEEYNKQDILVLEDVYIKIRPWIKGHPNLNLYIDSNRPVCPKCGGTRFEPYGKYYTNVNRYPAYKCKKCGAVSHSRISELDREDRKRIISGI